MLTLSICESFGSNDTSVTHRDGSGELKRSGISIYLT